MFDATISLGSILQIISFCGTVAYFIFKLQWRLDRVDEKLQKIDREQEKITSIIVDLAKQDQRLTHVEERLQEISNRVFKHMQSEKI